MKCNRIFASCEKDAAVFNDGIGINPDAQVCLEHAVDLDIQLEHINSFRGGTGQKPRFPDYNWRNISEYPQKEAS